MGLQNVHLEESQRNTWCATFQRQNTSQNNLRIDYVHNGTTEVGLADLTFFPKDGSKTKNAANISNASPAMFEVLNTNGTPYELLFANGSDCMVVSVPREKPVGVAGAFRSRSTIKPYCVILYRQYLYDTWDLRNSCSEFYKRTCAPWQSHSVNNTQCVVAVGGDDDEEGESEHE
ncbi:hypothetical protein MTO96_041722 [Rhipicephalus appendiculatus]